MARMPALWCLSAMMAVAISFLVSHVLLHSDQPFALLRKHNGTHNPANIHSRVRIDEIVIPAEKTFFQWWNFIVFDAETQDHFQVFYGVQSVKNVRFGKVMGGLKHGSEHVASCITKYPYDRVRQSNDFDFDFLSSEGTIIDSMHAVSDSEYALVGASDAPEGGRLEWDLTFHRENGYYGSQDGEDKNQCFLSSSLFGYHSTVSGWVKYNGTTHQISRDGGRFRGYAAGSWGCELPKGDPAISFPWTWFWLIIPQSDAPTPATNDLALCGGTARFASPIGAIEGGYGLGDGPLLKTDDHPSTHFSSRYAHLFHNTSIQMLLQATASDEYFSGYKVTQDNWAVLSDDMGTAQVPLKQQFKFSSRHLECVVTFLPRLEQYFRAPLFHDGVVFSDFRAVGVETHVLITHKTGNKTLVDTVVCAGEDRRCHNAVEFAYAPKVTEEAHASMSQY